MPVTTKRLRPHPRSAGYLLLEVMIGGVMAASIIGFMSVALVTSRNARARANKSVVAEQLLQERVADVAALGYGVTAGALPSSPEALTVGGQAYTRATAIAACTENLGAVAVATPCKDVTVTVSYPVFNTIESSTTTVRVFQP